MEKSPFLRDTTLNAIVRNEEINPAGGIVDYCNNILPYVEKAVIIDTKSTDNTFYLLNEMKKKYSNLEVYQEKFRGFAKSRNSCLEKTKTKYSLILDADERIPLNSLKIIEETLKEKKNLDGLCFHCLSFGKKTVLEDYESLNPRFFKNTPQIHFRNQRGFAYEELYDRNEYLLLNKETFFIRGLEFYHFLGESNKGKEKWYSYLKKLDQRLESEIVEPENFLEYELSKKKNLQREDKNIKEALSSTTKINFNLYI